MMLSVYINYLLENNHDELEKKYLESTFLIRNTFKYGIII